MRNFLLSLALLVLSSACASAGIIQSDTYGQELEYPTITAWPHLYISTARIWESQCSTNVRANWLDVETARGVYNWTCLDALVAAYQAQHVSVIYTFGKVPNWANGNQGNAAPPTNFQDFYDFVKAVMARYTGKIAYYEVWNEYGSSTFWTGTVAQIFAMAQNEKAIASTTDPNTQIICPSLGTYPVTKDDQLYSMGVGAYCDVMNTHAYFYVFSTDPNPFMPEQLFAQMNQYAQLFSEYGLVSKPFYVDEGALLSTVDIPTTQGQLSYVGVWQLSLANANATKWSWFWYDSDQPPLPPLLNTAYPINLGPMGAAFRQMNTWLAGATITTPFARTAKTNGFLNPQGTGAVVGTLNGSSPTGSLPSRWTAQLPNASHGVIISVAGTCSEGGHSGVEFNIAGTWDGVGQSFVAFNFEFSTTITTLLTDYWSIQAYIKLVGGTNSGLTPILRGSQNESGSNVTFIAENRFVATSAPLATDLVWYAGPITDALATNVDGQVSFTFTQSVPINATYCVADVDMDKGTQWTGLLTERSGATAEIAWDMNGLLAPSTLAVSNSLPYFRDLYLGAGHVPASGNFQLTNMPVIFESAQPGVWFQ